MVDGFPLVVVIVFDVDVAVNDRLQHVHKEEKGHCRENQPGIVARETNVDHTVAFEGAEWLPPQFVGRLDRKSGLLFAQAWNIHVDVALELWFNFVALDHLHDLSLLFSCGTVGGTNLLQVLVDFVLHFN